MKLVTLTAAVLLLSTGYAFAGGSDDFAMVGIGVVAWDTVCQGTSTA
jgi:hypothetical protein